MARQILEIRNSVAVVGTVLPRTISDMAPASISRSPAFTVAGASGFSNRRSTALTRATSSRGLKGLVT
jgi:hypothetical protein